MVRGTTSLGCGYDLSRAQLEFLRVVFWPPCSAACRCRTRRHLPEARAMFGHSLSPAAGNAASRIERLSRRFYPSILATSLEHVDDGIVSIDPTGRIAVCTAEAARLLGSPSSSAVVGRLAGSRCDAFRSARARAALQRSTACAKPFATAAASVKTVVSAARCCRSTCDLWPMRGCAITISDTSAAALENQRSDWSGSLGRQKPCRHLLRTRTPQGSYWVGRWLGRGDRNRRSAPQATISTRPLASR